MNELLRRETDDGPVAVEADSRDPSFSSVSRKPDEEIIDVRKRFERTVGEVRGAALSALCTFPGRSLDLGEVSLESGLELNTSAGAVTAKASGGGHLTVRLVWSPEYAKTA